MNAFDDEAVNIRTIQHYLYCPRRWGLIETECSWAENVFVCKGDILHERVDSGETTYSSESVVCRNVNVYNDEWNLFGVADCVELKRNKNGVYIQKYDDKFIPSIIEYKPTAPKNGEAYRQDDAMQLLAQKVCLDSILNTDSLTYFYYNNTRRRVKAVFTEADYIFLKNTVAEIRRLRDEGIVPKKRNGQHCSGCSMSDICMPKVSL